MRITMMDRGARAKVPCGTAPGRSEEGEGTRAGRVRQASASSALGGLAAALTEVLPRLAPYPLPTPIAGNTPATPHIRSTTAHHFPVLSWRTQPDSEPGVETGKRIS